MRYKNILPIIGALWKFTRFIMILVFALAEGTTSGNGLFYLLLIALSGQPVISIIMLWCQIYPDMRSKIFKLLKICEIPGAIVMLLFIIRLIGGMGFGNGSAYVFTSVLAVDLIVVIVVLSSAEEH